MPVISKQDQVAIAQHLIERLAGRVGIEVWTREHSSLVLADRDPCTHCDNVVGVGRELTSLHSLLSFTRYDLDRHADRAGTEGIERAPTTVLRAQGAHLQFVGYFSGLLFPAFVDCILLAGAGTGPLQAGSREALTPLVAPVTLEVLTAPYDPLGAYMLRLGCALAVEQHSIRFVATEMAEFPILAAQRSLNEVPTIVINGKRFAGVFSETELIEQIRRVVIGDPEPVIRERVLAQPYLTAEQALAMAVDYAQAAQAGAGAPPPEPPSSGPSPSGLYVPGR